MKKAFIIVITIILLVGVSGCESLRTAYKESPTPDAEVSPTLYVISKVDIETQVT